MPLSGRMLQDNSLADGLCCLACCLTMIKVWPSEVCGREYEIGVQLIHYAPCDVTVVRIPLSRCLSVESYSNCLLPLLHFSLLPVSTLSVCLTCTVCLLPWCKPPTSDCSLLFGSSTERKRAERNGSDQLTHPIPLPESDGVKQSSTQHNSVLLGVRIIH